MPALKLIETEIDLPVPPAGTLLGVSNGTAVLASRQWLHDVNATGIKPGDLSAVLEVLEEQDLAGYMVSLVKKRTGIDNTLFASTKGRAQHAARIKIAINPPDSLNEASEGTSMALHDFSTVGAYMTPRLVEQVKAFIELNREALLEYWDAKIDTETFLERLKPVSGRR
jgi:hypothetical protein